MDHDTVVLIVAAGRGERALGTRPKQFAPLGGVALVARAIDAFAGMPVVVVIGAGQRAMFDEAVGGRHVAGVVTGGASRRESVRAGLDAIEAMGTAMGQVLGTARRVLIHDAARPFVPRAVIDRLVAALDEFDGAVPTLPVSDTLLRFDGDWQDNVVRDHLFRVQTPQAFGFDAVLAAHRSWPADRDATDDAQMVQATGGRVTIVEGDVMLDKITHRQDFARAEAQLSHRLISRSATGFDVHRLEVGEELWLGGIRIDHSHGLSGHSDADVALHALTDAVLGTVGAGDIGSHFPPTDPQWRGARSNQFLAHAGALVRERGGIIDHVDVTLICEAPKLAPHREAMRTAIAEILQIRLGSVSVKATTTERLGFAGRGEGIAAQATATCRIPEEM